MTDDARTPPFHHVPRRLLLWIGLAALLSLAIAYGLFQIGKARCFQLVGEAICHVETTEKVVALSFDDGPTKRGVDSILATLEPRGIKATFFLIGGDIARQPDQARRLIAAGHELGNHSFTHQRMWLHRQSFYADEIARTNNMLRLVGARDVRLFRPPYGKKLIGLPRAVQAAGLRTIMWDVEDPTGKATRTDPSAFADAMLREVRPGSIILIHAMYPANQTAREALPLLLDRLRAAGYRIVPVGTLLATQPANSQAQR